MADSPPYWALISVLFSSKPLTPAVAMTLHHAACDLHRTGAAEREVAGDLLSGKVRNLNRHVLLGTIGGPAFEAEIEIPSGPSVVRFLVTREGLEVASHHAAPPRPRYLN